MGVTAIFRAVDLAKMKVQTPVMTACPGNRGEEHTHGNIIHTE